MTKQRQRDLSVLFGGLYRAAMTAEQLVDAVSKEVLLRPRRSRRDNLWAFSRLTPSNRLAVAAEYVALREDLENSKPAIYNAMYLDQNFPGGNFYDSQPGEWNLFRHANGRLEWQAAQLTRLRGSVCFSATALSEFYPALLRLAVGLRTAFLISERDTVMHKFRAVIVAPGESRFRHCGPNYFAPAVPSGTALLFPGEPEETGRVVLWEDGEDERWAITVWGKFFAVQIDSGFPSSQSVPASP